MVELAGYHPSWINVVQHVHPNVLGVPEEPAIEKQNKFEKIAGYPLNSENGFPNFLGAGESLFDGEFHTWYMRIDEDLTYVVVDDLELVRVPTARELVQPKYIMTNLAYDSKHGSREAVESETFDMKIDYIRVRQRESDLEVVPEGFAARPTIAGAGEAGEMLTVGAHAAASQIDYFWYRDGIPIADALGATYVPTVADIGHKIRCQVRALSLRDEPDAWTGEISIS